MRQRILTFVVWLTVCWQGAHPTLASAEGNIISFVTRYGSQLLLDGKTFRFAGPNIFWLALHKDSGSAGKLGYPTAFRIDDALETAVEMGATVVRSHSLGVSTGNAFSVEGDVGTFNSEALKKIDYAIARAKHYGLRLIVPLTDNLDDYYGGKYDFVKWMSPNQDVDEVHKINCTSQEAIPASKCPFYTDSRIVEVFKSYVRHLLNHKSTTTGIALKDEPSILAWETGAGLAGAPAAWTAEIAAFIKHELGARQLVMDGCQADARGRGHAEADFEALMKDVDIVVHSFLDEKRIAEKVKSVATAAYMTDKALVIPEFDWNLGAIEELDSFLKSTLSSDSVSGTLYCNLFSHDDNFGFVESKDPHALNYPGDTAEAWTRIEKLRRHAFQMQGIETPPAHRLPAAPEMSWGHGARMAWRGAAGASEYNVQGADSKNGPWQTLCDSCVTDFDLPWIDQARDASSDRWYRVQGVNPDEKVGAFSEPYLSERTGDSQVKHWSDTAGGFATVCAAVLFFVVAVLVLAMWCRKDQEGEDTEESFLEVGRVSSSEVGSDSRSISRSSLPHSQPEVELASQVAKPQNESTAQQETAAPGGLGLDDNAAPV